MKLPDKREVGGSTPPGPTNGRHSPGVSYRAPGLCCCRIGFQKIILPVTCTGPVQWLNEEHVIATDLLVHVPVAQPQTNKDFLRALNERNHIFNSIEDKIGEFPGVESAGFNTFIKPSRALQI
jgi:hypothetical protein